MKPTKISILVVDDHTIVREGIVFILKAEADMQVVAQASNGMEAIDRAKALRPDIMLLDLRMDGMDGLEVIDQMNVLRLPIQIIVLTTFENEHDIHRALKSGARAYLMKDSPRKLLLETIRNVRLGNAFIPPRIGQKLIDTLNRPGLTERELETLHLIAAGRSNKEIGAQLHITEGTVKTHVKSILKKLNTPGRTAAVREAVHRGLVHMS